MDIHQNHVEAIPKHKAPSNSTALFRVAVTTLKLFIRLKFCSHTQSHKHQFQILRKSIWNPMDIHQNHVEAIHS